MKLPITKSHPVPHHLVLLRAKYTRIHTRERGQLCMPHTCRAILTTHYVTTIKDFSLGCYKAYDALVRYRGADKSLARPTSRCILFHGENISFDAGLVIYIYIVLIFLQQ
jgi:hypothetical protein